MRKRGLSYDVKYTATGSDAVAACSSCGARQAVSVRQLNHPDFVLKKFNELGWRFDKHVARKCICPKCLAKSVPAKAEVDEPMTITTRKATDAAPTPPKGLADLTPHTKVKIRNLLDGNFDDERGCYLNGYSDQRIGKEADVPWSLVAQMREAAYGPIKADPEADTLRAECAGLKSDIEAIAAKLAELTARIDKFALTRR